VAETNKEIEMLKTLSHPAIIKIFGENIVNGVLEVKKETKKMIVDCKYIITEYVENGDLIEYVMPPFGRLPENVVKGVLIQLINVMKYLETMNISHRDLKLDNIALNKDFLVTLLDFGYAKSGTIMSSFVGTKEYMAPEIIEKMCEKKEIAYFGQKVDIFALGMIIYSLYVGSPPFKYAVKDKDIRYKLFCLNPSYFWSMECKKFIINEDFQDLVSKMLSAEPSFRPTFDQILSHPWLKANFATEEQIKFEFTSRRNKIKLPTDLINESKVSVTPISGVYKCQKDGLKKLLYTYNKEYTKLTSFYSKSNPDDIMKVLYDLVLSLNASSKFKEHDKKYKFTIDMELSQMKIRLYEASGSMVYVEFMHSGGSKVHFGEIYNELISKCPIIN
jgi:serine/threonine protein kinase